MQNLHTEDIVLSEGSIKQGSAFYSSQNAKGVSDLGGDHLIANA